ncbi:MAG: GNAT family N-acetyltransferase [Microcoleus sp.]
MRKHKLMNPAVTIRMLNPQDCSVFDRVTPDVFDNEIDPHWANEFLNDPRHHIAVAIVDDRVVGMASAVHYVHPDKSPELWINEVGVAPPYQRQGIGKQLLQALFAHGRSLGCQEAWVGTEEYNIAARRLYASVGGKEERMVYITFELESEV